MNEKKNVVSKVFGILFSLVLVISSIYCLYQLIQLNVLTSKLLFLATTIFILIDLIFVLLLCFISKGIVSKIICILLVATIFLKRVVL